MTCRHRPIDWSESDRVISRCTSERKKLGAYPEGINFLRFHSYLLPGPSSLPQLLSLQTLRHGVLQLLPRKLNCNLPIWLIAYVDSQKRGYNRVFVGLSHVITHGLHRCTYLVSSKTYSAIVGRNIGNKFCQNLTYQRIIYSNFRSHAAFRIPKSTRTCDCKNVISNLTGIQEKPWPPFTFLWRRTNWCLMTAWTVMTWELTVLLFR